MRRVAYCPETSREEPSALCDQGFRIILSLYVLNDSPRGWTSDAARAAVGMEQYEHEPDDEHWGFGSWNDFFTRRFRDGARPVASPEDDKAIVSACESTPYRISAAVQRQDRFWIKSQPYSLVDMLADEESVDQFVGGTVYQAFLSATNYHRWHSPVAGTIVRAFVQQGTYYSEADSEGADAVEPRNSQPYLAHVAARAIIVIQADDPVIGLMAFVAVGMLEVSSCIIQDDIAPGYHVAKGEETGYFQFGGSTHCLVFRPGAIADFSLDALPQPHDPQTPLVLVRSKLATANPTTFRNESPRGCPDPSRSRRDARSSAASPPPGSVAPTAQDGVPVEGDEPNTGQAAGGGVAEEDQPAGARDRRRDLQADGIDAYLPVPVTVNPLGSEHSVHQHAPLALADPGLVECGVYTRRHLDAPRGGSRRIDYVLVRADRHGPLLQALRCDHLLDRPVGGVWASDHYGVAADLTVPQHLPGTWGEVT